MDQETATPSEAESQSQESQSQANESQETSEASAQETASETQGAKVSADDWASKREKYAAGDPKKANLLNRLGSEDDVYRKLFEQEKTIRSGKHKAKLGEDASDEDIAQFREANNIPEEAKGYYEHLNGIEIGDEDKAAIDSFFEHAHSKNFSPADVAASVDWYFNHQAMLAQKQNDADAMRRASSREALEEAYGDEFKSNMAGVRAWLENHAEGFSGQLARARMPDGTLLGDSPEVMSFLVSKMRDENPYGTVIPGDSTTSAKAGEARIVEIEKIMRDSPNDYYGTPVEKEYDRLIEARERHLARQ